MLATFVIFILNTGILTAAQEQHDCTESYPADWKDQYHGLRTTTVTGKTCKMWRNSSRPNYGNMNYCRASAADQESSRGPWCYVNEIPWWEFCFVPLCHKDCRKSTTDKKYEGTLNITSSGYHCREWSLESIPPSGGRVTEYPTETLNYCRAPDGDGETTPWCYTTSKEKRWEHCNIPLCGDIQSTLCPDVIGSNLLTEPSILTGYKYNSVVTFKCKKGYIINGPSAIKCTVDAHTSIKGHWNASQPQCEGVPCPNINASALLMRPSTLTGYRYGSVVTFKCKIGYKIQGLLAINCTVHSRESMIGHWNATQPECLAVPCPDVNASDLFIEPSTLTGYNYSSVLTFKCKTGYKIQGPQVIKCTVHSEESITGHWNATQPKCVAVQCPNINASDLFIEPSTLTGYNYSSVVTFRCKKGYTIQGPPAINCTVQSGESIYGHWNVTQPKCVGIECSTITLNHSNVLHHMTKFPETIQVECDRGYVLNGNGSIQCTESGNWSHLPTCDAVICPDLNTSGLLIIRPSNLTRYQFDSVVSFDCKKGYRILGYSAIMCTVDSENSVMGRWNTTQPECVELSHSSTQSSGPGAAIGGGISAAVLVVVIVIIVVIFIKRRQRESNRKEERTNYKEPNISKNENSEYSEISLSGLELLEDNRDPSPEMNISGIDRTYNNETNEDGGYYDFTEGPQMSKTAILVKDFYNYVENGRIKGGKLEDEFLKFKTGLQYPTTAAMKPGNKIKNKYKNLFAYDETRFVLKTSPHLTSDYINSSYVNGYGRLKKYIASQGPQDNTVNEFWQMVWQVDCGKIVMLTNVFEEAKQKCNHYWPETVGKSNDFDGIVITLTKEDIYSDFTIRHIKMLKEREKKTIIQFHFTAWPDKDVPKYSSSLVHFRHKVNSTESSSKGPVIVHCSAGIGRTGTYIALDYAVTEATEVGYVDVFRCVETLRRQRVNMVQTARQYVFLHDAVLEALVCPYTGTPTNDFPEVYKDLMKFDSTKKKHKLHVEYDLITSLSRKHDEDDFVKGKNSENRGKNRYSNIIPVESEMPRLISTVEGHNEYINAVFLPGYKSSRAFVVTQMPMENTLVDFWRLVYDYGISVIVMLNTEYEQKDVYWPKQKDENLSLGPFKIKQKKLSRKKHYVVMELSLTSNHEEKGVTIFQQMFWNDEKTIPDNIEDFFSFITDIEDARGRESGEGPLLVHCLNGCDKSGLYCVMSTVIEKMRIEHDVDIKHTIQQMRNRRPQIISNYEQYRFLYEAVIEYLKQFETYANFS